MNTTKTSHATSPRNHTERPGKAPRSPWTPENDPCATSTSPGQTTKPGNKPAQNGPTEYPTLTTDGISLSREATDVESIVLRGIQREDSGVQNFLDRNPGERNHVLLQSIADWAAQ